MRAEEYNFTANTLLSLTFRSWWIETKTNIATIYGKCRVIRSMSDGIILL